MPPPTTTSSCVRLFRCSRIGFGEGHLCTRGCACSATCTRLPEFEATSCGGLYGAWRSGTSGGSTSRIRTRELLLPRTSPSSHIQRFVCQPEKTTFHGGQSRSWSAEQGKKEKEKVWQRPLRARCSFGEKKKSRIIYKVFVFGTRLLFLTFSVLVANPKKLLYTVANPARALLNREKITKEKVWQHTRPHPPHCSLRTFRSVSLYTWYIDNVCVCVFFSFILDITFVGRTSRGHTGGRSHRIFHPPSFCGACL